LNQTPSRATIACARRRFAVRRALKWSLLSCAFAAVDRVVTLEPVRAETRFVVFTRLYHDAASYAHFVAHYVGLGFHRIIALQADHAHGVLYPADPHVTLVPVENKGDLLLHEYAHLVLRPANDTFDWVLVVDADELLLINTPTIAEYVASCVRRTPTNAHNPTQILALILFRWATVQGLEPWCSGLPLAFDGALAAGVHHNIWIKSLTHVPKTLGLYDSHRALVRSRSWVWVDGGAHQILRPRSRATVAPSPHVYLESALLHMTPRSVGKATMMRLRAATAAGVVQQLPKCAPGGVQGAAAPKCAPGGGYPGFDYYSANSASLMRMIHARRAQRSPTPARTHNATADLARAATTVREFAAAYGIKFVQHLGNNMQAAVLNRRCNVEPVDLTRRISRLMHASAASAASLMPACNQTLERAELPPLLAAHGLDAAQFDAFVREVAGAIDVVAAALRAEPYAPLPGEPSREVDGALAQQLEYLTKLPGCDK
jgi:hypothetical protein